MLYTEQYYEKRAYYQLLNCPEVYNDVLTLWWAMYYLEQSKSFETHKGYESHWNMYLKYCVQYNLNPLPYHYIRKIMYTSFRARYNKLSTVKKDNTVIEYYNRKYGYPENKQEDNTMYSKILQGIAKCYGAYDKDPRIPIVWEYFKDIVTYFDLNKYNQLVIYLSFVVTSQACLRQGEVYPSTTKVHADSLDTASFRTLWCRNFEVIFADDKQTIDYIVITLRATKNDKKKKHVKCPLGKGKWPLAPVLLFLRYMRLRKQLSKQYPYLTWRPKAPLFQLLNGDVLTQHVALKQLRYVAGKMKLPIQRVTLYGFRYGTATSLARRNVDTPYIKTMGRWHSDAFRSYIKMDPKMLVNLMQTYQHMPIIDKSIEFAHQNEVGFEHIPE